MNLEVFNNIYMVKKKRQSWIKNKIFQCTTVKVKENSKVNLLCLIVLKRRLSERPLNETR